MRRLVLFLVIVAALLAGAAAFDWWIDPFGQVWKPEVFAAARVDGCLVSEELVGSRYWSFKRDVFFHRPTRVFVVGSSRVLKLTGGADFSNLGYPGSAPETILRLFRSLPARPVQRVYFGVDAFWLNRHYVLPATDLGDYKILEYLLARSTFTHAVSLSNQANFLLHHRWKREVVGGACILDRFNPAIAWRSDGSRVWGWELDPHRFPALQATRFTGDLATWRNGYYDDWTQLDVARLRILGRALALARVRGWTVIGFAPPEPPRALHALETDPRLAPRWREYLDAVPKLFARYGFTWVDTTNGSKLGCRPGDFPDAFHSDARCSARLRAVLDRH